MKIKNILVSQPAPAVVERSPLYEMITKYRTSIDFYPFIKIEGVNIKEFRCQRIEILDHAAIIFTSRTTIDHFFRICEEARISIPEDMKYLCNTEAVALYLQKYIIYRKRKIFFADGTFSNFMELILKHKDLKLLLTLSEPHSPEIPVVMEKMKLKFDKAILSRTASRDLSTIDIKKYDLVVIYSPAEVTALIGAFGKENIPMLATFGNGTARAANEAGLKVNAMAPTPEAPSMAKALDTFIGKINNGESVSDIKIVSSTAVEDFMKAQEAKPAKRSRASKGSAKTTKNSKAKAKTATSSKAKATTTAAKTTKSKTVIPKPEQ